MANPLPKPRKLDVDDYARIHLPRPVWDATLEGVPEGIRAGIAKYTTHIKEVKSRGYGLYLCGDRGVGKTGVASVILKTARSWGYTAYATSVTELREAIRNHEAFDSEASVYDRCRTVDFLLLDDLQQSDVGERFFGVNDIRNLITNRFDRGLITVITSLVSPKGWTGAAEPIQNALVKSCSFLKVEGPDRHMANLDKRNEFLR